MKQKNYAPMWRIQQAASPTEIDLYIYGDVEGDYYDWWSGQVIESETSATHLRDELAKHPEATTINVYINSYGGSVYEGTAIYNQLKRHPARKVVRIDGFACSVASVIAMAGDTVIMPPNTLMMIHDMWAYACGNARELRKLADDLDVINAAGRGAYLAKAGGKLSEAALVAMMEAETWLTAQQCLDLGLCDQIGGQDTDLTAAQKQLAQANQKLDAEVTRRRDLAAMLREITTTPVPGNSPPPPQGPQPPTEQNAVNKLAAFFHVKKEEHN